MAVALPPPPSIPLPFPLEWLPQPTYLVGGAVRDQLLQQQGELPLAVSSKLDLDLVVAQDPVNPAAMIARKLKGGFVLLDDERRIARIVLPQTTIDVALQIGGSIETDLQTRDFTCNAIALELSSGQWIDPLQGNRDIADRCLRMIHPDNLSADPLRLLRAYRQAAQLGFDLDPATRTAIRERVDLLKQVAGERVRTEISHLLSAGTAGIIWLHNAWQDGVLGDWLPGLTDQGFEQAQSIDPVAATLQQHYPRTFAELDQSLADQRSLLSTVKLAALLSPNLSSSDLRKSLGSDAASERGLEQTLDHLKFSRMEQKWILKLQYWYPQLQQWVEDPPNSGQLYQFFESVGSMFPSLILFMASLGTPIDRVRPWLDRYEDPNDPIAHLVPLVDGHQLMQALGLKPGPWIGELLTAVRVAQAEAKVTTIEQAIEYAQAWLQRSYGSV